MLARVSDTFDVTCAFSGSEQLSRRKAGDCGRLSHRPRTALAITEAYHYGVLAQTRARETGSTGLSPGAGRARAYLKPSYCPTSGTEVTALMNCAWCDPVSCPTKTLRTIP